MTTDWTKTASLLKAVVIGLGVLILLGVSLIVYKMIGRVGDVVVASSDAYRDASVALPAGSRVVAMTAEGDQLSLLVEDADALADVQAIADVPGYSLLACGIGSLTQALDGDREAAEAGNQEVLAHTVRIGVPDMITANSDDVARRIEEGFLGLLMSGDEADEAIEIGRAAAGR